MYQPRFYRRSLEEGRFSHFEVSYRDTDLWIAVDAASAASADMQCMKETVYRTVLSTRACIVGYSRDHSDFLSSLHPIEDHGDAPVLVRHMIRAGIQAGTGPMASVAGAFAQAAGRMLLDTFRVREVIVENGGDIWLYTEKPVRLSVYAGSSPLSGKIQVEIPPDKTPLGVCTSSATVGHSMSFGKADAVMAASADPILADALATGFANRVKSPQDVDAVIEDMKRCEAVLSGVIIIGERAGLCGSFTFSFV